MAPALRLWPLAVLVLLALPAAAQDDTPRPRGGEPDVKRTVIEDDAVRIEELRVRGQTQRIVVHHKQGGARAYEIVPATGGRDLSQDKRTVGQRLWSVFSF